MLGSEASPSSVRMSDIKKQPIMDNYPSTQSAAAEPSNSADRISGILDNTKPAPATPPKLWLAITALTAAIVALIGTIIFAFVIIPNNQCECACSESTESTLTANAGASSKVSQVTEYTLDDGATVIRNVTHRYIYENETTIIAPNQSCPTSTVGIINVGLTYEVGGYDKWTLNSDYPDFYPLPDVHASVGDSIFFMSTGGSSVTEDVWIVPKELYDGME